MSKDVGKTPVEVNDFPGFVSNRVQAESLFAKSWGTAARADMQPL